MALPRTNSAAGRDMQAAASTGDATGGVNKPATLPMF